MSLLSATQTTTHALQFLTIVLAFSFNIQDQWMDTFSVSNKIRAYISSEAIQNAFFFSLVK